MSPPLVLSRSVALGWLRVIQSTDCSLAVDHHRYFYCESDTIVYDHFFGGRIGFIFFEC